MNTIADLFALLEASPDKCRDGSPGQGSLDHLAMEAVIRATGLKMVHAP